MKRSSVSGAAGAITALPIEVEHGTIRALGFRIGTLAYLPDVKSIPADAENQMQGLDTLIIDALRPTPPHQPFVAS